MLANRQSNWSTNSSIYFAKVPNFQELCTVSLLVCNNSPGIQNISQFGTQPQIIKCRELIFTESCVLASPSLQEQGLIFVIIPQSFWKTGKLQLRCQKSGLKISKPTRVIPAVFQACLSYTLRAKLAPLWNKAGDLYIQGRDFLTCSMKANAMSAEINVTDAEICIALKPKLVKLTQSDLREFEVAPGVLEHFFSSNTHIIPEYAIDDKWCHILPSLKKGKVVSITHQIPPVSPFKTYKDIRRYWKNAYGYRLPESEVGIIYFNVYFPAIGNTLFTYPDFCVFKREPILMPRVDPMSIIPSFLADVETKLPNICGSPFKVNPKAQYMTAGLYQASIQNNSLSCLTLAAVPPAYPRPYMPVRQYPIMSPSQGRPGMSYNGPGEQHRQGLPNRALAKAFDVVFHQAGGLCLSPKSNSQSKQQITPQYIPQEHTIMPLSQERVFNAPVTPLSACASTQHNVFHYSQHVNNPISTQPTAQMYRGIPSPQPIHQYTSPVLYSTHQGLLSQTVGVNPQTSFQASVPQPQMLTPVPEAQQTQGTAKLVPSFRPHKTRNLSTQSQSKMPASNKVIPVFKPAVPRTTTPTFAAKVQLNFDKDPTENQSQGLASATQAALKPNFSAQAVLKKPIFVSKAQTTFSHRKETDMGTNMTKTSKRKAQADDTVTTLKKLRAKPKVQEGVNMQALVASDQLSKMNTVTLLTWLKEKKIKVKSREKKADLVAKVMQYITAKSTEN